MENRRLADGRVVQRQVLYLREINESQREAWRKTIDRGIPTEASLAKMRSMGASYLVGTPKGRLTTFGKDTG